MSITLYSKKQSAVALSTAETEYIAVAAAVQYCLWLDSKDNNLTLNTDNQSAIKKMKNHATIAHMKHINIKFHLKRDAIRNMDIKLSYRPTAEMKPT
ncbi:Zea mays Retrotransposon Opie-2 [Phytophthora megakarya]|uniref:Zea mays Retrotransposon Opie-2 n=1 Tax=Phytophthora megakarya TaxID=4795 RepID=A0A225WM12_9STRA|nr:Zea mays Retrotransposon Opie-2 [Phytophthora megakarya]